MLRIIIPKSFQLRLKSKMQQGFFYFSLKPHCDETTVMCSVPPKSYLAISGNLFKSCLFITLPMACLEPENPLNSLGAPFSNSDSKTTIFDAICEILILAFLFVIIYFVT